MDITSTVQNRIKRYNKAVSRYALVSMDLDRSKYCRKELIRSLASNANNHGTYHEPIDSIGNLDMY